jgi:UDP-xylose/UDP-N-acetylglucosamine transporter B4
MGLAQDSTYAEYGRQHWEEGMFYIHFLALPMFLPLSSDIAQQVATVNSSPSINLFPAQTHLLVAKYGPVDSLPGMYFPVFWILLVLNMLTQLVCVSGVHRLTAKVSSLTVTLVLVVRKAVSLVLSVVVLGGGSGSKWLWNGSLLVLAGTVIYTLDGARSRDSTAGAKLVSSKTAKHD